MKRFLSPAGTPPVNEKWREAVHETLRKNLLYIWEYPEYKPHQECREAQNSKNYTASSTPALTGPAGQ
ncbi:hypothetical protein [Acetobacter orleanensis]|uniref:Uncharacterized protein n=1 Tax=Acetobacter orleanensis TaxID=104099 RepID=A0A4Y3TNN6_9PROT|nr:hypothetical protein [Acetobacter orleanensis]KXV66700.1 hypothetical protein AD949_01815 [Acetobacter orleanensis]PCD78676.1 hypothetical protein CO710_10760 [Acetobacter orleanensis]GAN69669.1 hypothetical protein Abol_050_002 [Acetobacter orleanensis JCM 7639]GBR25709.1 hypothetical protein AA0473_0963 [Acetobacter orleanensis NRIC 0473]GEB83394.1 hypothetical protein AOR01nite_18710 [Acetobacter orleanensis]